MTSPTLQFHKLADAIPYEQLVGIVGSLMVRVAVSHPDADAMLVLDSLHQMAVATIDGLLNGTVPIGAANDRGTP
jgi:hypothetical protein